MKIKIISRENLEDCIGDYLIVGGSVPALIPIIGIEGSDIIAEGKKEIDGTWATRESRVYYKNAVIAEGNLITGSRVIVYEKLF